MKSEKNQPRNIAQLEKLLKHRPGDPGEPGLINAKQSERCL